MATRPAMASKGRLLILGSEFPPGPGGIGTHAYQLARHSTRLGWEVQVLTPQAYVTEAERNRFNIHQSFRVTTLPDRDSGGGWWWRRLSLAGQIVSAWQPNMLIASGRRAIWTAAALGRRYGTPWIAIGHGSEFVGQSAPVRFLTAQALARATAVVAVSRYTAGLIEQVATPARMVIIPNGADGDRFYPKPIDEGLCRDLGLDGKRVILTVGHISERKAQDVVISALPQIVTEHPDVTYLMVGLPTRRAELQQLGKSLGVGDRLHFAGSVPEDRLVDYYNLAELFVLVSRQADSGDVEGYGIVVKEAALCGRPSVVSQGCGLTEAIDEGLTGLSVPPDDPGATAVAINALLADDCRRQAMGQRAREQALGGTWAERVAAYDELLQAHVRVGP